MGNNVQKPARHGVLSYESGSESTRKPSVVGKSKSTPTGFISRPTSKIYSLKSSSSIGSGGLNNNNSCELLKDISPGKNSNLSLSNTIVEELNASREEKKMLRERFFSESSTTPSIPSIPSSISTTSVNMSSKTRFGFTNSREKSPGVGIERVPPKVKRTFQYQPPAPTQITGSLSAPKLYSVNSKLPPPSQSATSLSQLPNLNFVPSKLPPPLTASTMDPNHHPPKLGFQRKYHFGPTPKSSVSVDIQREDNLKTELLPIPPPRTNYTGSRLQPKYKSYFCAKMEGGTSVQNSSNGTTTTTNGTGTNGVSHEVGNNGKTTTGTARGYAWRSQFSSKYGAAVESEVAKPVPTRPFFMMRNSFGGVSTGEITKRKSLFESTVKVSGEKGNLNEFGVLRSNTYVKESEEIVKIPVARDDDSDFIIIATDPLRRCDEDEKSDAVPEPEAGKGIEIIAKSIIITTTSADETSTMVTDTGILEDETKSRSIGVRPCLSSSSSRRNSVEMEMERLYPCARRSSLSSGNEEVEDHIRKSENEKSKDMDSLSKISIGADGGDSGSCSSLVYNSGGTNSRPRSGRSQSRERDNPISDSEYLIDDEISDQPELTFNFNTDSSLVVVLSRSSSEESLLPYDVTQHHLGVTENGTSDGGPSEEPDGTSDSAVSDASSKPPPEVPVALRSFAGKGALPRTKLSKFKFEKPSSQIPGPRVPLPKSQGRLSSIIKPEEKPRVTPVKFTTMPLPTKTSRARMSISEKETCAIPTIGTTKLQKTPSPVTRITSVSSAIVRNSLPVIKKPSSMTNAQKLYIPGQKAVPGSRDRKNSGSSSVSNEDIPPIPTTDVMGDFIQCVFELKTELEVLKGTLEEEQAMEATKDEEIARLRQELENLKAQCTCQRRWKTSLEEELDSEVEKVHRDLVRENSRKTKRTTNRAVQTDSPKKREASVSGEENDLLGQLVR